LDDNERKLMLFEAVESEFQQAKAYFLEALELCRPGPSGSALVGGDTWEAVLSNLAFTHHKLEDYDEAIRCHTEALSLKPRSSAIHAGLAHSHQCKALLSDGSFSLAIEWYHKALALNPDDTFCSQMLLRALEAESVKSFDDHFAEWQENV
jgi:anaphase-promoting complex subunit 6